MYGEGTRSGNFKIWRERERIAGIICLLVCFERMEKEIWGICELLLLEKQNLDWDCRVDVRRGLSEREKERKRKCSDMENSGRYDTVYSYW